MIKNSLSNIIISSIRARPKWVAPYFYVQTTTIAYKCAGVNKTDTKRGPFFRNGDWDLSRKPIDSVMESDPRYLFFKEYFFDKIPLKDTTAFNYYRQRQVNGNPRWGAATEEALVVRLEQYIQLFRSIESKNSLRPNIQYSGRRADEIGCVLARDGNLLKSSNGNNRFAIALLLEIPRIPVNVHFVHASYLDEVLSISSPSVSSKLNRFLNERLSSI